MINNYKQFVMSKVVEMNGKKYMSVADYAKEKDVTKKTVYNWIEAGIDSNGKKVKAISLMDKTCVEIN